MGNCKSNIFKNYESNNNLNNVDSMTKDLLSIVNGDIIAYLKTNNLLDKLKNDWVKIGDTYEYKLSYALGGERTNLLCRVEGKKSDLYNIVYTTDTYLFF